MPRRRLKDIMPLLTYKLHPVAAASSRVSVGTAHGLFPSSAPLKLRNSSYTIPTLIYGTAWKKESTAELVYQAIKAGFRGVDTAGQPRHYREDLVGYGIRRALEEGLIKREDIFIQTKYTPITGQDPSNIPYSASSPIVDQVHSSIASSLHNLRSGDDSPQYLDSVLIHSPLAAIADTLAVWEVLSSYVNRGQIRHIGISNCPLPTLRRLNESAIKPAIVQNRFYPDTEYEPELRVYCKEQGIIFQSFWTLTGNPMLITNEVIVDLAKKVGVSEEVAMYALVLGLGGITVLDGTTNVRRMHGDLEGVEMVGKWAKSEQTILEWEDLMRRFRELLGEDPSGHGDRLQGF